ncbi:MAG: hypothetical protein RMH97_09300 [Verrucomicrobiales bacterium]|nr:hypothetical protein [Verrucomicrobiales bacterium]
MVSIAGTPLVRNWRAVFKFSLGSLPNRIVYRGNTRFNSGDRGLAYQGGLRVGLTLLFHVQLLAGTHGGPQAVQPQGSGALSELHWARVASNLAGRLTPGSSDGQNRAEGGDGWISHAREFEILWRQVAARLSRIAGWRTKHLDGIVPRHADVFYPFGGPDAVTALTLFPEASHYLLVGLEPVGSLPATLDVLTADYRNDLRTAFRPFALLGFFRTEDLTKYLGSRRTLDGVLPLLAASIARLDHTVLQVSRVCLNNDEAGCREKLRNEAVAIDFADRTGNPRRLTYIRADLADFALGHNHELKRYLRTCAPEITLLKCASYLLHKPYFSILRTLILDRSRLVLQDDSGIPIRYFVQRDWSVRFYGAYEKPIPLFTQWYQPDLEAAVRRGNPEALPFKFGYSSSAETSILILALRKQIP